MAPEIHRGDIWWANLPAPRGSGPGYRRPVLVIQSNIFNASRLGTVLVAAITSNTDLGRAPGNVRLDASLTSLKRDSVVNVTQLATLDRGVFAGHVVSLPEEIMDRVDMGLRLVLSL